MAEIDNFYLLLFFNVGIFIYIGIAIITFRTAIRLANRSAYMEAAFLVAILSIGAFESSIVRPEIFCMPLYWKLIFRNETVFKTKKKKALLTVRSITNC